MWPRMASTTNPLAEARQALRLFWEEADRVVRTRMALSLALVLAGGVLAGAAPVALKFAVESFEAGGGHASDLGPAMLIAVYVACLFFGRALTELKMLMQGGADRRIQRFISRRLFEHVMRLPMRFHLERKTGAIGQTLALGLSGYQQLLQQVAYTIAPVVIELATVCAVLTHFGHPAYLVILGVAGAAYLLAFTIGAKRVAEPSRAVAASGVDAHAVLADCLLNHETVKYFNAEQLIAHRYHVSLVAAEGHWERYYRVLATNGLAIAVIFAMSLAASLALSAREVLRDTMSIGDFVLINAYVLQLVRPLEALGTSIRSVSYATGFLHKLLDLFAEQPEPNRSPSERAAAAESNDLAFDSVTFSYRPERRILDRVSFALPAGKTVAIVGLSGSGKSTIVRLLFRLYEPDSGRVLLGGRPIADMSLEALRETIAVVPQDTVLFNDTIAYNIGFGKPGSAPHEIEWAARLARLHDFVVGLPDGYDTIVGERGLKLSGGEKQRVAIARAAIKRPRMFVFDEATSSLDSKTEREILRNLVDLSRGTTTLMIAHRLSTVAHADEILVLDRGAVVERGRHTELLERRGRYAELWLAQQSAAGQRSGPAASVA
jgi:ABC-type transport system involved in Fe-S cluster assembly fused permease/ATPase subunit